MAKKKKSGGVVVAYFFYLLLVWGFFRLTLSFDEVIEEMWFKPVIWVLPMLSIWWQSGRVPKFFKGNWLKAEAWGLGWGVITGGLILIARGIRGFGFDLSSAALGETVTEIAALGLVTAIVEQLVFSGFIYQKLRATLGNTNQAMFWTGIMFGLIRIPIGLFVIGYSSLEMLLVFVLMTALGAGNAWVMERTNNVLGPIVSHWVWGILIAL